MAYLETIKNYLPYLQAIDSKAFISKYYGNGHTGLDSVGNNWTMPVCAIFDGTVASTYNSKTLGNVVEYTSNNNRVNVLYYHLSKSTVKKGDIVTTNTIVGYEGSTGILATGKHLHISIKIDNVLVNPLPYLKGDKTLPLEINKKEILTMVREVIKEDLNLRQEATANSKSFGFIPKGTLINIIETKSVGNSTWGKHSCTIDGQLITGWSNISQIWSTIYKGELGTVNDSKTLKEIRKLL